MDITELRDYCLSMPLTSESTPFDDTTLVYKVRDKMFACADMVDSSWVAVKCDPSHAIELRETYDEISTAKHFNKTHWNSVKLDGDLPAQLIRQMILESYFLVIKGMTRVRKEEVFATFDERMKQQYDNFMSTL